MQKKNCNRLRLVNYTIRTRCDLVALVFNNINSKHMEIKYETKLFKPEIKQLQYTQIHAFVPAPPNDLNYMPSLRLLTQGTLDYLHTFPAQNIFTSHYYCIWQLLESFHVSEQCRCSFINLLSDKLYERTESSYSVLIFDNAVLVFNHS